MKRCCEDISTTASTTTNKVSSRMNSCLPEQLYYQLLTEVDILRIYNCNYDNQTKESSSSAELSSMTSSTTVSLLSNINSAKVYLIDNNPNIRQIHQKLQKLSSDDKRIPPNSSLVQRSMLDARYMMSWLCILSALIKQVLQYPLSECEVEFKYALLWFPRSIEGNYQYSMYLRQYATTLEHYHGIHQHLSKAVAVGRLLIMETSSSSGSMGDDDIRCKELQCHDMAEESFILYLCQQNQFIDAIPHLRHRHYTWRLSSSLLCYDTSPIISFHDSDDIENSVPDYLVAMDDFLPDHMLQHLSTVFRSDSPYWKEHDYDSLANASKRVGYFSYLYPYHKRRSCCSIEQIIDYIHTQTITHFPDLHRCNYAEWWVHSRPHCSGHQLHFDSDETALDLGDKPNHPIVTMIIYITDSIGGPTLVTDQTLSSELAHHGWLCYPKANRAVIFDAKYLHGVLPGRGVSPCIAGRRLTFMVGFWENIKASYRGVDQPGAGQPFPDTIPDQVKSSYTWHHEMMTNHDMNDDANRGTCHPIDAKKSVVHVSPVWEPIHAGTSEGTGSSYPTTQPRYQDCFQGF